MGAAAMRRISRSVARRLIAALTVYLQSGVDLQTALESLGSGGERALRHAASRLSALTLSGVPLSKALEELAGSASGFRLISFAEHTGSPARLVHETHEELCLMERLRSRVLTAAVYPACIVLMIAAGILIADRMDLEGIANGAGNRETIDGVLIRARYAFAVTAGVVLVPAVLAGALAASRRLRSCPILLDRARLLVPPLGSLELSSSLRAVSTAIMELVDSGLPPLAAIRLSTPAAGNRTIANGLTKIADAGESGAALSNAALRSLPQAPGLAAALLQCEQGADAVGAFTAWQRARRAEQRRLVGRWEQSVEPLFVVTAGVFMVVVIASFVRPLLELYLEIPS